MPVEQMNISLPPKMARYIRDKVKAGQYTDASELVRDAVRHMQQVEAAQKERASGGESEMGLTAAETANVRTRVQQGIQDLEEGRFEEFDGEGLRHYFAGIHTRLANAK